MKRLKGDGVSPSSKRDLLCAVHSRYRKATREQRSAILDEFCAATGYHRKYAIALLNKPREKVTRLSRSRKRAPTYSEQTIKVLAKIWEAAGYPWSERLKALLPLWLPAAKKHSEEVTEEVEQQLLRISPRQIDRRLKDRKVALGRRIYGRTKPGTLLKHHIPIKTDNWDVDTPGFAEIDLVSHSGSNASGEFIHSLNLTDIHTTWVETKAVMGKGQTGIVDALIEMHAHMPFRLRGIDSDNGSEFLNNHLYCYCQDHQIQFTRGRPYKKDDNAHIEQKNWTHVRKLLGWDRFDSTEALKAINELYRNELRLMMNLFQPSVKLVSKTRVGSRIVRRYDEPQTPLDRLKASGHADPRTLAALLTLREQTDPFTLSHTIERKLERIYTLAKYTR
jgi:hypothetical protein